MLPFFGNVGNETSFSFFLAKEILCRLFDGDTKLSEGINLSWNTNTK